ncbi:iron-containing alcohol dehydrogenase [Pseudoalteromonas fenneropenaei]|uniref:Iron-containing alcohol dehydrogenase n=1 Tax=Pseudoalteromonas fenneropenaei TaxID=1737459 RepID=A0ABV7CIH1_9GAMM
MTTYWYRLYHFILKCIVVVVGIPSPKLYRGTSGLHCAIEQLKLRSGTKVLVVSDHTLVKLGVVEAVLSAVRKHELVPVLYSDVDPNPTLSNVENGLSVYHQQHCHGIIAVGGGSVIDCAKFIGARVVRPKKSLAELKGLFKILRRLPPNIAIPTTAGTGSETTVAAVVNDPINKQKFAATDLVLVPQHAVLLPELTLSLPPLITATTALDALTHAIEALLSINCMQFSRERALKACALIFDFLPQALQDGQNEHAREQLLLASHYAGQAFTRTSVGYVHAISHQLSATYGTAHGLANSVLLLPVLRWYGEFAQPQLASIATYCQMTSLDYPTAKQADDVLQRIEALLAQAQIPKSLPEIRSIDIGTLAKAALAEAHPDYPVPVFMDESSCQQILTLVTH